MVSFSQPNGLNSRPRLKRLHDVQEEIFRLLQLLLPDEFAYTDNLKSAVAGSPLLRMQVLERHAYTTFFRLTYEFAGPGENRFMPDAHVRCYHDARMAEATSFDCQQACVRDTHPAWLSRQMMQRAWRKNRALERWLDHLLSQGHSVSTMRAAHHAMESGPAKNALIPVS